MKASVLIQPRDGVDAKRIIEWLEENFQYPLAEDRGPQTTDGLVSHGGNPLVNASIQLIDVVKP